jgi:hypothetical protein
VWQTAFTSLIYWLCPALVAAVLAAPSAAAIVEPEAATLLKTPSWKPLDAKETRTQALAWLEEKKADAAARQKAADLWANVDGLTAEESLVRLAKTFALADDNARKLVELCSRPRSQPLLPPQPWLTDAKTPPFEARNMRLFYGIWLTQGNLFDESLEQFGDLKPKEVVDPASLLFYQGVACHRLLQKDAGLKAVDALLENPDQSPRRYTALARLMQADLKNLQDESLDHISRRMQDIERRLDLGRAGPKVRKIEDGVIESLDKLIKKLEDQQRQRQQQASSGGSMQPSTPASESRIMGGKGPGEVTKKDIGNKDGWGNLPPKQREEAMQQIGREFPSHYRDAIEQYFRKLAGEGTERD